MTLPDHFSKSILELRYHCCSSSFCDFEQKCGLFPRTKIRPKPVSQDGCSKSNICTLKRSICLFGHNWSCFSKVSPSLPRLQFSSYGRSAKDGMILSVHFPTSILEHKYQCYSSCFRDFEQKCILFPRTKIRLRSEGQLMLQAQSWKYNIRTRKLQNCLFGHNCSGPSKISPSLPWLQFSFVWKKCKGRYDPIRPFSDKYSGTQISLFLVKLSCF